VCLATAHPAKFSNAVEKALHSFDQSTIHEIMNYRKFESMMAAPKRFHRIEVRETNSLQAQDERISKVKAYIEQSNLSTYL
jgi:threonine synthase